MSDNKSNNIFSKFTNLYSLTKTLRFELRPTDETKLLLQKTNNLGLSPIQTDQNIDDLYNREVKPMYDRLHEKFITESLEKVNFNIEDLENFETNYVRLKKLSKNCKQNIEQIKAIEEILEKISLNLRKQVTETYVETAISWKEKYPEIKFKKNDYQILTEKESLLLLKEIFPEKIDIINKFIGFHGYFAGFNQNRINYYTDEGKATEVANRIVNENLVRFIENRLALEEVKNAKLEIEKTEEFKLENYKNLLTQKNIDELNKIIGGENVAGKPKIPGINEKINLWLQQKNSNLEKDQTKTRLPKLKALYKQIGSDKKSVEIFQIKEGQEWQELQNLINNQEQEIESGFSVKIMSAILYRGFSIFFENWQEYDLSQIYFNKASLNTISSRWFGNWRVLAEKLKQNKAIEIKNEEVKLRDISLAQIKESLETLEGETLENLFKLGTKDKRTCYQNCFVENDFWMTFLRIWHYELKSTFENSWTLIKEFDTKKTEAFEKKTHGKWLKEICDSILATERMVKYNKRKQEGGDANFYEAIDIYLQKSELIKYYNAFRNYISQKPFETDKIKLNFENGSLLGGWSDGQEKVKSSVILKNGKKIYLGILMDRGFFRTDKPNEIYQTESPDWQRLILTNLKFQTLAGKGFLGKYGQSYGDLGKQEPLKAVILLQEFIQENYVQKYPQLNNVAQKKYEDKKTFDAEIKLALEDCFTMKFVSIKENILRTGLQQEKFYLFEIKTKDTDSTKKGKKDLQTYYWETLFSLDNLHKPVLALNGGAEVFWRSGQEDKLEKKKDTKGKIVLDAKRYAKDKLFFHVPVTINYGKPKIIKFKDKIQEFVAKNKENLTYLGIDRGEKHLIYYCLVDHEGNILKQGSFNKINGVPYHQKLTDRAGNMMEARKNWEAIGNIKNFKAGYLSQVVHEIYNLVIKYNALIIMEDLNSEFKAKRTAQVEKSVYKKFELTLAKKLNYLVLKDREPNEEGGVLNAYQLTPYISAGDVSMFEKSQEWGVIKYVKAAYTSTTDPIAGWRKNIYLRVESNEKMRENILKFKEISWDSQTQSFLFKYNPKDFIKDKTTLVEDKEYIIYSCVDRIRSYQTDSGVWENREFLHGTETGVTSRLIKIFDDFGLKTNIEIKQQIEEDQTLTNNFYEQFIFNLNLILQIRNSKTGAEENDPYFDFIQSPVKPFFDSRYPEKFGKKLENDSWSVPENGDANGAFHIAKKGIGL